jgi:hypothetical protein
MGKFWQLWPRAQYHALPPAPWRQSAIFASCLKQIALFSSVFQKFAFTEIKIRVCCAYPVPPGGALRPIATYVGAGSDGRLGIARRAMRQGDERKRVVPTPRRWCQVLLMSFGEATRAIKPGTPAIECTHFLLLRSAKTDSLAHGALAEGDLMTMAVGLGRFGDRRLEKGGRYCMRPSFVGLVLAFGGLVGAEHRRFGSRVFCATRG